MKKEKELLEELMPIFLRYDDKTVSDCLKYIQENDNIIREYKMFLHNIDKNNQRTSTKYKSIDSIMDDKSSIINEIKKYMNSKLCSIDTIKISVEDILENEDITSFIMANNKKDIIIKLIDYLKEKEIDKLVKFRNSLQTKENQSSDNNLENWGKLIVKDDNNKLV